VINFLLAPDKFKDSLSSFEVCTAIEEGLLQACPLFRVVKLPMADGGDGLAGVIRYYTGAVPQRVPVQDPLGRIINAEWLLSADGKTAFIEMAEASGLGRLKTTEYNPLKTSTFGTGQLIRAAVEAGVQHVILGIGGSATNDGGIGMAAALGIRFLDEDGNELAPVGGNLGRISTIDRSGIINLQSLLFEVACDVKNPLLGTKGATLVYAPQKGANASMLKILEEGMQHFAGILEKDLGTDVTGIEGGGAAGGMGAGSVAFLGASLVSGISLVMQYAALEKHLAEADIVITGEGKVDEQTLQGKVVAGVASLARQYQKRVIAFCGSQSISSAELEASGIEAVFPIMKYPMTLEESKKNAFTLLKDTAFSVGSLLKQP
jgi:glycerate kinase